MSNLLILGKELPDSLELAETFSKNNRVVFSHAKLDSEYANFEAENSINQQRVYLEMSKEIKEKYPNIHVYNIENGKNIEETQSELKEILKF